MKIDTLELTKEEMNEAVQNWLNWRNIKVTVTSITEVGYPLRNWQVELEGKTTEQVQVAPPFNSIDDLTTAIEKGKL